LSRFLWSLDNSFSLVSSLNLACGCLRFWVVIWTFCLYNILRFWSGPYYPIQSRLFLIRLRTWIYAFLLNYDSCWRSNCAEEASSYYSPTHRSDSVGWWCSKICVLFYKRMVMHTGFILMLRRVKSTLKLVAIPSNNSKYTRVFWEFS